MSCNCRVDLASDPRHAMVCPDRPGQRGSCPCELSSYGPASKFDPNCPVHYPKADPKTDQSDCNCPNGLRYDQCGHPKHGIPATALCAEPGPLGGRCDMEKGHEGLHHGYLSEAGIEVMSDFPPCMNESPLGGICLRASGHEGDHALGWRDPELDRDSAPMKGKPTDEEAEYRPETVKHPEHYGGDTPHEVIKCLTAWGFTRGPRGNGLRFNFLKYGARAGLKGDELEDLRKAAQYLQWEIEAIERERGS